MIYVAFSIRNPFSYRFENVMDRSWQLTENKSLGFEFQQTSELLGFEFTLTHRQDHAGISIGVMLLGYNLYVNIHDNRHWNYEKGRWNIYNDRGEPI